MKLTLGNLGNITGAETTAINTINANNDAIETAIENTLSRDGTSPNTMNVDLDMNAYDIINAGNVDVQTLSIGGVLSSTFSPSYLEGTFIPGIAFGGASVGVTYGAASGVYTKIGRVVTITGRVLLTSKGSSSGIATVTGFPVNFGNYLNIQAIAVDFINSTTSVTIQPTMKGLANAGSAEIVQLSTSLTNTNFTNTTEIRFGGSYQA